MPPESNARLANLNPVLPTIEPAPVDGSTVTSQRSGGKKSTSLTSAYMTPVCGWVASPLPPWTVLPGSVMVIGAPPSTAITVGDFLTLMVTATAGGPLISWASSDESVASVAGGGAVEAKRPGAVTVTASAEGATSAEIALTVVERPGGYVADEIDYFLEIAFGSEFGGATSLLRRWPSGSGPLIRVNGTPSTGDREVLDSVIAEINRLALGLDIELVADFPTVEMHFVPQSDFATLLPQAPPGNNGLVWLWWGEDQYLFQSVVLISTTTGEALRAHIIREEVTQMLGLLQDSFRYPQSIFYQAFSDVTEYLPIDRSVIDLLHRPELRVGMTTTRGILLFPP